MQTVNIYTVAELNRRVRVLLEEKLPQIAVKGEISNLTRASSGHCYFSLKDQHAQIRCACFSPYALRKEMAGAKNGQEIVAYGRLSLYEARGDYQLIVSEIEASGLGQLYQQFVMLKTKLEQEGLFLAQHKKALPRYPQTIAIITSANGAAYHDIMKTLNRRYPLAQTQLYPTEVQGKHAHLQIIAALQAVQNADVIILARGGGSLEDLWSFNEEALARAIFDCPIPIITGIGHETDFTIADFVADLRASTPSIAAEKASPDQAELRKMIRNYQLNLERCMQTRLKQQLKILEWLKKPFEQMDNYFLPQWQNLDQITQLFHTAILRYLANKNQNLERLTHRLKLQNPELKLRLKQETLSRLRLMLLKNMSQNLQDRTQGFELLSNKLNTLSPKSTLARGYAIVSYQQHVMNKARDLPLHAMISVQLAEGRFTAKVEEVDDV